MKKFPKPWYRPSRGLWYVTLYGVQHNLGPDKEAAFKQSKQLLVQPEQTTSRHAVASIIDAFLDWSVKHQAERTYFRYRDYCQSFINQFPDLLVAELRPFHIQEWVDAHAGWGNTTKRNAIVAMKRAFNWAEKQGRVSANPIRHTEKPTPNKREEFVTKDEHERVLALVKDQHFRDLLTLAWETGARPQELFQLEGRSEIGELARNERGVCFRLSEQTPVVFHTGNLMCLSVCCAGRRLTVFGDCEHHALLEIENSIPEEGSGNGLPKAKCLGSKRVRTHRKAGCAASERCVEPDEFVDR